MATNAFKKIEFTVDVALLRELGERLVGKPQVALAELVKNSYDADAYTCRVVFGDDAIEVIDDGNGMTFEEFQKFWMRVGTTHKQEQMTSPRLKRAVTGSKGVGRLSVQFLGNQLEMWTMARGERRALHVRVDWASTHKLKDLHRATAGYRFEPEDGKLGHNRRHGTRLVIKGLNQKWESAAIRELAQELWFLQPPEEIRPTLERARRFRVDLEGADEEALQEFKTQMHAVLENWTARIDGSVENGRSGGLATVKVKLKSGEEFEKSFALEHGSLDETSFSIRIFNLSGRQPSGISVHEARSYFRKYGGMHIYDDGFRLPFYGGEEQDWLRLEHDHSHRLMVSQLLPAELQVTGGMLDLPTLGRVFGSVNVSTSTERRKAPPQEREKGKYLNLQVTRDRLIDNKPFEDLVYVVRWAFDFYANRVAELKQRKAAAESVARETHPETALLKIRTAIAHAEPHLPKKVAYELQKEVNEFEDTQRTDQEKIASERIILGALATAGMSAVALEHELGKEIAALSDHVMKLRQIAKGPLKKEIGDVAKALEKWIERASGTRLMFSPLMNRADREQRAQLKARRVVERVSLIMKPLMRKTEVEVDAIPLDLKLPRGTMAGWNAVFQNVLMNSVNAMLDQRAKRIRCHGGTKGVHSFLTIEDTGVGVDLDAAEDLFKPFVRRLEISEDRQALGLGGVGLGLTIVRIVASSLGCRVEFVKPTAPFRAALQLQWEEKT
jgi:signal transduction histidine kinase